MKRGALMKESIRLFVFMALMLGVCAPPAFSTTITLAPTLDVYSTKAFSSNLPATDSVELIGGLDYSYPYHNGYRPYLQFNLEAIPDESIITDATLTLTCWSFSGVAASFNLYHVANDAAVTPAMTWNTQPAADPTPLTTLWIAAAGAQSWDLTTLGNWNSAADLADDLLTLQLRVADETVNSDTWAKFRSANFSDVTYAPYLTIDYASPVAPAPAPIPGAVWLLGSGLVALVLWKKSPA
jgi:hypothetical protein